MKVIFSLELDKEDVGNNSSYFYFKKKNNNEKDLGMSHGRWENGKYRFGLRNGRLDPSAIRWFKLTLKKLTYLSSCMHGTANKGAGLTNHMRRIFNYLMPGLT